VDGAGRLDHVIFQKMPLVLLRIIALVLISEPVNLVHCIQIVNGVKTTLQTFVSILVTRFVLNQANRVLKLRRQIVMMIVVEVVLMMNPLSVEYFLELESFAF